MIPALVASDFRFYLSLLFWNVLNLFCYFSYVVELILSLVDSIFFVVEILIGISSVDVELNKFHNYSFRPLIS
jgi:hypothetical protein